MYMVPYKLMKYKIDLVDQEEDGSIWCDDN